MNDEWTKAAARLAESREKALDTPGATGAGKGIATAAVVLADALFAIACAIAARPK